MACWSKLGTSTTAEPDAGGSRLPWRRVSMATVHVYGDRPDCFVKMSLRVKEREREEGKSEIPESDGSDILHELRSNKINY